MKNKPEFQLAATIFVAMSIVGTIFGLWWAGRYAPAKPRTNVENVEREATPVTPEPYTPAMDTK